MLISKAKLEDMGFDVKVSHSGMEITPSHPSSTLPNMVLEQLERMEFTPYEADAVLDRMMNEVYRVQVTRAIV